MDMKLFEKERNEAILSLDKEKITKYMKKYSIDVPSNDLVFWVGVHKAVLHINAATKEQKEKSFNWLIENGFSPTIR